MIKNSIEPNKICENLRNQRQKISDFFILL